MKIKLHQFISIGWIRIVPLIIRISLVVILLLVIKKVYSDSYVGRKYNWRTREKNKILLSNLFIYPDS